MARRKSAGKKDIHQAVTESIVQAMQAGVEQWQMPWHGHSVRPTNVDTNKRYRGVNVVSLWSAAMLKDYPSSYWGTYRQWQKVGGQVRAKEKSSLIVFYKRLEIQDDTRQAVGQMLTDGKRDKGQDQDQKTIPLLRYSSVFNAEQQDGWEEPIPELKNSVDLIAPVQAFIDHTRADIRHGGGRAYYRPATDTIQMPDRERFHGTATSTPTEAYFSTLLHELTHNAATLIMPRRLLQALRDGAFRRGYSA